MSNNKQTEGEEYLKHLVETDNNSNKGSKQIKKIPLQSSGGMDSEFLSFDTSEFPCGKYYPKGTHILLKPVTTKQIQDYSMVDDKNYFDITLKMNDILDKCVRVKYPGEEVLYGSNHLKEQDRFFTIFVLREMTFQNKTELPIPSKCPTCKEVNKINMIRENFINHKISLDLEPYYDNKMNRYSFEYSDGSTILITPPNIGLQKSFTDYIVKKTSLSEDYNTSFLKIVPFTLVDRTEISYDEIEELVSKFEKMDLDKFQLINDIVSKLILGVEKVSRYCSTKDCEGVVEAPFNFPTGASGIFVIQNAFERFVQNKASNTKTLER